MTVLEQVTQMRNQGQPDSAIQTALQGQGVSPNEINDAFNQAQIKNAIADAEPEQTPAASIQEQSLAPPIPQIQEETYTPQTQEMPQQQTYPQNTQTQEFQEIPGQESYDTQDTSQAYATTSTDTAVEIAEQVFLEKIQKTQKQVEELNEFKTLAQTKIETVAERLKKIESTIDKLQTAILNKVGSYGTNLESIKKEMAMMQNSFSKTLPSLVSKTKTESKSTEKKTSRKKK